MDITQLFIVQLSTAYLVWICLAGYILLPWLKKRPLKQALIILVIPQMFRYIGVSVAASPVVTSDSIPLELANHIALGDELTALCAIAAFIMLQTQSRWGIASVWVLNIVGFSDQIMTMTRASQAGLAEHMNAAWYVPTVLLPMMTASHILLFYFLWYKKEGIANTQLELTN